MLFRSFKRGIIPMMVDCLGMKRSENDKRRKAGDCDQHRIVVDNLSGDCLFCLKEKEMPAKTAKILVYRIHGTSNYAASVYYRGMLYNTFTPEILDAWEAQKTGLTYRAVDWALTNGFTRCKVLDSV